MMDQDELSATVCKLIALHIDQSWALDCYPDSDSITVIMSHPDDQSEIEVTLIVVSIEGDS